MINHPNRGNAEMEIPEIVRTELPQAADMIDLAPKTRLVKRYTLAEVAVARTPQRKLAVRVIWHRPEAYEDNGPYDGSGSVRAIEEALHDDWCPALYADLAEALRWGRSPQPQRWREERQRAAKA